MSSFVLVPEALLLAGAVMLLMLARFTRAVHENRRNLPVIVAALVLVGFFVELWAGAVLGRFLDGAMVQDRFALFAKAAVLLATAIAIAAADWSAEDSLSVALAMQLLAALGVMVAASSTDLVGLWAGLELAAIAGVVMVSLKKPGMALRLMLAGAVASTLLLVGLATLYAAAGTADLQGMRTALRSAVPTVPFAIPVLLLLAGLAVRSVLAPFQFVGIPIALSASPVGAGLVLGLVAAAAITAAIKIAAALGAVPAVFSPVLTVFAGLAMLGGGSAALATRSPRARLAYLATSQVGWIAAGLTTDYRVGLGASLFLLGAFALAATCGPSALGAAEGGEPGLAGMSTLRPARAAAVALAFLSLAGAPPLAGFFGEFAIAAGLAQSGHFELLALGLLGAIMSVAAALGTVRVIYVQSPAADRRAAGSSIPVWSRFSTAGSVALSVAIAAYGLFGNPILGLADQGAKALGLR